MIIEEEYYTVGWREERSFSGMRREFVKNHPPRFCGLGKRKKGRTGQAFGFRSLFRCREF
jgi:hypothetical protein